MYVDAPDALPHVPVHRPGLAPMPFVRLQRLVKCLRCPSYNHGPAYELVLQHEDEAGDCGLSRCLCFAYPVLNNVPILTQMTLTNPILDR